VSRRLPVLALAALVLSISAGCADDVSPALRVGDVKVGDDELLDEVAEWAGNPAAVDPSQLTGPPGTYPQDLVAFVLQQRINMVLHEDEFEALDLELNDDLRTQALTILFQGDLSIADQALGGFSEDYATAYVDGITMQIAVESTLGEEEYLAWRTEALEDAGIEVSPRYGSWDEQTGQVVPPEGPRQPGPVVGFGQ
jgi:hypothetical protein